MKVKNIKFNGNRFLLPLKKFLVIEQYIDLVNEGRAILVENAVVDEAADNYPKPSVWQL